MGVASQEKELLVQDSSGFFSECGSVLTHEHMHMYARLSCVCVHVCVCVCVCMEGELLVGFTWLTCVLDVCVCLTCVCA